MEKVKDVFISHDKCDRVTTLSGDKAKLFTLALYPVRCDCGNLLPQNEMVGEHNVKRYKPINGGFLHGNLRYEADSQRKR